MQELLQKLGVDAMWEMTNEKATKESDFPTHCYAKLWDVISRVEKDANSKVVSANGKECKSVHLQSDLMLLK